MSVGRASWGTVIAAAAPGSSLGQGPFAACHLPLCHHLASHDNYFLLVNILMSQNSLKYMIILPI